MRVLIIGSRDFPRLDMVRRYIFDLDQSEDGPHITVISGGAKGVDSIAEEEARAYGFNVEIYPADWKTYGRGAGLKRNIEMIERADMVVAFWDGKSPGTRHSIREALKRGKRMRIFIEP